MFKALTVFALALLSLSTIGCKKGSVSGRVIDPLTGKPVTNPTIWIRNTTFKVQSPDGSFKFEGVKLGEHTLSAGKNKHSEYSATISLTEEAPDLVQDIYIYSREGISAGLFRPDPNGAEKWLNLWTNWEVPCGKDSFGYRLKFRDAKTKRDLDLPDPLKVPAKFSALYYQSSSVSRPFDAHFYPLMQAPVSSRSQCVGFEQDRMGMFPDKNKGVALQVTYKSDNMYQIDGTIPKGRYALVLTQDGKLLKPYFIQVE